MEVVKIFEDSDGRQLITLPKGFEFDGKEIIVNRIGEVVVLVPKSKPFAGVMASLDMFSDDFMEDYQENSKKERA